MKRLLVILLGLLLLPMASAWSVSYTGWGPGFWSLGGDASIATYSDSDMHIGAYGDRGQWTIAGSERRPGGFSGGVTVGRQTNVRYEAGGDGWHYPSVTYGDWRVERATVNCPSCGFGASMGRVPVQGHLTGQMDSRYGWQGYVDTTNYDRYRNPGTYAPSFTHSRGSFGRDVMLGMYGGYDWRYPRTHTVRSNIASAQSSYVVPGNNW